MKKKTLSVHFRLKNRPWGWHKWNHVPKPSWLWMPEMKNLRGNLGNLSCSRKQFGSHRMAFLNVKKTYSYQVKKKKKILQLLTRKAKVPFLKSWPHNFVSGQSLYCCATLLHRQVPQVWIEKCSGLSLIFFEIKILNMNEVSKTQKLLEITSKEWKCNAKKNRLKHGH